MTVREESFNLMCEELLLNAGAGKTELCIETRAIQKLRKRFVQRQADVSKAILEMCVLFRQAGSLFSFEAVDFPKTTNKPDTQVENLKGPNLQVRFSFPPEVEALRKVFSFQIDKSVYKAVIVELEIQKLKQVVKECPYEEKRRQAIEKLERRMSVKEFVAGD